ncbi:thioredoxin-dependent thiol peroxidase [archaeon]|jgi:thioredoxin-dependent peroxiredoxin|nr:thioredoxin-dependent thiol peroxidase [archaeon]MBT6761493.1 thioredoxin-dependent thiol peroxidase [archaeon]
MVEINDKVLNFSLLDKDGNAVSLYAMNSKYTVVYFYPRDNTPGCTIEAKDFSDALEEFKKLGVAIIGISGGDQKSKTKFCEKHDLKLTLLSDPEFKVAEDFGSYGQKMFMGRTFLGIRRDTYLLDEEKKVIKIYRKVKAGKHVAELLDDIKELEK